MLVVVLKAWVTETKDTELASKISTILAKSLERPRQSVDFVDNDSVNLPGGDVSQKTAQRRTLHCAPREARIVVELG